MKPATYEKALELFDDLVEERRSARASMSKDAFRQYNKDTLDRQREVTDWLNELKPTDNDAQVVDVSTVSERNEMGASR